MLTVPERAAQVWGRRHGRPENGIWLYVTVCVMVTEAFSFDDVFLGGALVVFFGFFPLYIM